MPNDERIHVGHQAAMDLVQCQLDPARQALARPRQRILIADAVGLGKTLEAGILVSELIARGRGRRILVLVLKSMLTQFQKEFWNRFTIPLTRLDSIGIQRVRRRIPTNHNPFYYYDKTIISIDTLKQAAEYRTYVEQAWWDVVVIDEAHNVADRGTASLRSHPARLLARRSDTLIMLSATPHDGKARSFASLMNMLDPTAIADPDDYTAEDFRGKGLVVRRFKKDIQHEVREASGAPAALLGPGVRGHQPALPLPPPDPLRHALVAEGVPAAQRPDRPLRPGTRAPDRLPRDPERQRDDPWRHAHPRSAPGEGRAGLQERRRSLGLHESPRHRRRGADHHQGDSRRRGGVTPPTICATASAICRARSSRSTGASNSPPTASA